MSARLGLFLMSLLSLGAIHAFATCSTKVDSKKVFVFVDMNGSYPELQAAEEGACLRGEAFISIPPKEVTKLVYEKLSLPVAKLNVEADKLRSQKDKLTADVRACVNSAKCSKETLLKLMKQKALFVGLVEKNEAAFDTLQTEFETSFKEKFSAQVNKPKKEKSPILDLSDQLALMQQKGQKLSGMAVSGHDGSGDVYGVLSEPITNYYFDEVEKFALADKLKEYPDVTKDMTFLGLWGCNTVNAYESASFKKAIPQLKVIAGYSGTAPANTRSASSDYLKDVMVKSKNLYEICSESGLKKAIEGISSFNTGYSAVYVSNCKDQYLYSHTENYNGEGKYTSKAEFNVLEDAQGCTKFNEFMATQGSAQLGAWIDGSVPLPEDRLHGALRSVYVMFRQKENCVKESYPALSADRVGLLLFFDNVKKNFSDVFEKQIVAAENLIQNLDDQAYGAELSPFIKKLKTQYSSMAPKNIDALTRKKMTDNMSLLGPIVSSVSGRPPAAPELRELYRLTNKYLYELDANCQPFSDWHAYVKGSTPSTPCE